MTTVDVRWYGELKVIKGTKLPHVVLKPKDIHGRWSTRNDNPPRQCIPDFLHLDPYAGCDSRCTFCSLPTRGHNYLHDEDGRKIYVAYKDYPTYVYRSLHRLRLCHCLDLTASSDPFMGLEIDYHYTVDTIKVLKDLGLPVTVTTKRQVPQEAIDLIAGMPYSWLQFSVVTLDEGVRRKLMPGGASVTAIVDNIVRAKAAGIYVTARMQPWILGATSVRTAQLLLELGVDHIIMGFLRIPKHVGHKMYSIIDKACGVDLKPAYTEKMPGYWCASTTLRRMELDRILELTERYKKTFAVCEEYDLTGPDPVSLMDEYRTSRSCEGMSVPLHVRLDGDDVFSPLPMCDGNCLICSEEKAKAICRVPEFYRTGTYQISSYRRFSKRWESGRG